MPTETDPVCGMKVAPARAAGQVERNGTTYFFCGKSCVTKFTADPDPYLKPALATDPVCHMKCRIRPRPSDEAYNGTTYYFCCQGCHDKFVQDPQNICRHLHPRLVTLPGASKPAGGVANNCPEAAIKPGDGGVHLSHGPRGPRKQAWRVPDLRHGAGTRADIR